MNTEINSEEIARRAYAIFEREGRQDGHDLDHWIRAEAELREEAGASNQNGAITGNSSMLSNVSDSRSRGTSTPGELNKAKQGAKRPNRPIIAASRN